MSAFGADEHLRGNGAAGSSVFEHNDGLEISEVSRVEQELRLMPRRPAAVTQADVARAIRAAKQAGAAEVEVRMGEQSSIVIRLNSSTVAERPLEQAGEIVL